MPRSDLYQHLVPFLSPMSYASALRADPILWRWRRDRKCLPTVAQLVYQRVESALPAELSAFLLGHVRAGRAALAGRFLMNILRGEPVDMNNICMEIVDCPNTTSQQEFDEDNHVPIAPSKAVRYARLYRAFHIQFGGMVSFVGDVHDDSHAELLMGGNAHLKFQHMRNPLKELSRIPFDFMRNLLRADRLYISNLDSILTQSCRVTQEQLAANFGLGTDLDYMDTYVDVLTLEMDSLRSDGFEISVGSEPPTHFGEPISGSTFVGLRQRKELLGSAHPPRCKLTVECGCTNMARPSFNCMNAHYCQCEEHIMWGERAYAARLQRMREEATAKWVGLFGKERRILVIEDEEEGETRMPRKIAKRLRFE